MTSNIRYTIAYCHRIQIIAISKGFFSNTRNAIGDSDRGHQIAIAESTLTNTHYGVRDNSFFTTSYKYVSRCFYNRITTVTTIICCIFIFHNYYLQSQTSIKRRLAYTRNAIRYSDRE